MQWSQISFFLSFHCLRSFSFSLSITFHEFLFCLSIYLFVSVFLYLFVFVTLSLSLSMVSICLCVSIFCPSLFLYLDLFVFLYQMCSLDQTLFWVPTSLTFVYLFTMRFESKIISKLFLPHFKNALETKWFKNETSEMSILPIRTFSVFSVLCRFSIKM